MITGLALVESHEASHNIVLCMASSSLTISMAPCTWSSQHSMPPQSPIEFIHVITVLHDVDVMVCQAKMGRVRLLSGLRVPEKISEMSLHQKHHLTRSVSQKTSGANSKFATVHGHQISSDIVPASPRLTLEQHLHTLNPAYFHRNVSTGMVINAIPLA